MSGEGSWMASDKMISARRAELPSEPDFALIRHSVVFMPPQRLTDVLAWHRHIPFAFWCIAELRPGIVVELGTYKGDSYCAFCQAVDRLSIGSRCFAVDTWEGDEHSGKYGPEVYEELAACHDPRYGHFSVLVKSTFDNAVIQFGDSCIDLVHIDGSHTYDAVRHDFETWMPKLSRDALVLLHDTAVREKDFGVWRFWGEISQKYLSFEFVHGHGLGVLAMGGKAEGLVDRLRVNAEQARYVFSRLGEMVINTGQIVSLRGRHVEREGEITRLGAEAAGLRQTVAEHEHRLGQLGAELLDLRESASWRLAAPLRELLRFGDRLRRAIWPRRYRFKLHPALQLVSISAEESLWQAQGPDPQFLLIPERGRYPTRWCELDIRTNYPAAGQFAVLRVDLGGGFSKDGRSPCRRRKTECSGP